MPPFSLLIRPFFHLIPRAPRQSLIPSTASFTTSLRTMAQEFKLKGISSLDLKNGEKREVEVEGIENGKVLLVKQGSVTHAMSSNCTHYGAPLKLGVVTPDGRLTCAWHGGEHSWALCLITRLTDCQPASTLLLVMSRMPRRLILLPNSRSSRRVERSTSRGMRARSSRADDNQTSSALHKAQRRYSSSEGAVEPWAPSKRSANRTSRAASPS